MIFCMNSRSFKGSCVELNRYINVINQIFQSLYAPRINIIETRGNELEDMYDRSFYSDPWLECSATIDFYFTESK